MEITTDSSALAALGVVGMITLMCSPFATGRVLGFIVAASCAILLLTGGVH